MEYSSIKSGSDLKTYKHNAPENLGLQISGISSQQTLFMLVSIRAQHSPSTSFVALSLRLSRSLIEFLP